MKTEKERHIIWSSINLDYNEWKDNLVAEFPDKSEDELYNLMYEMNYEKLEDIKSELDIQLDTEIIVIADIGRWNGRAKGCKVIKSGNIKDCFQSEIESLEWYIDEFGDLRCTAIHHDGTNYYLYRMIRENTTDKQLINLQDKIYDNSVQEKDIEKLTSRIGDIIIKSLGIKL